jgi:hypothetical protein
MWLWIWLEISRPISAVAPSHRRVPFHFVFIICIRFVFSLFFRKKGRARLKSSKHFFVEFCKPTERNKWSDFDDGSKSHWAGLGWLMTLIFLGAFWKPKPTPLFVGNFT